jgi:hypothetical protein
MLQEKIDTMAKMFDYVSRTYPNRKCLGTREILAEEDEVQPNGRVFKKVSLERDDLELLSFFFFLGVSTTWAGTGGRPSPR